MYLLLFSCKWKHLKLNTMSLVSGKCVFSSILIARNFRWDCCVSQQTTVWQSGCTFLHSAHSWHRLHVYLRVRTHCIVNARWQKPGIVPPMVHLQLETSVKCDLSQQCFAPSAEQEDIYWVAYDSALIRNHQLYPQPCARVINVVLLLHTLGVVPVFVLSLFCSFSSLSLKDNFDTGFIFQLLQCTTFTHYGRVLDDL